MGIPRPSLMRLACRCRRPGGVEFYPSALEKGVRSERALKVAIAEMYVQGVSTRRVTEVMQQLCGLEVSSTQVSRAAKLLDEELSAWRQRPIADIPYRTRGRPLLRPGLPYRAPCTAINPLPAVSRNGAKPVFGVAFS